MCFVPLRNFNFVVKNLLHFYVVVVAVFRRYTGPFYVGRQVVKVKAKLVLRRDYSAIRLRYDLTTMYCARLLPFDASKKLTSIFRRSRIVVV